MSQAEYQRNYRKNNPEKIHKMEEKRRKTLQRKIWTKNYNKKYAQRPYVKNKVKDAVREFYRNGKLELITFMGGKCSMCGLTPENVKGCLGVFVVDEIIPLGIGKRKFINLGKEKLEFSKKLFSEKKTQLLCQNCSAIKTWKNKDYSH